MAFPSLLPGGVGKVIVVPGLVQLDDKLPVSVSECTIQRCLAGSKNLLLVLTAVVYPSQELGEVGWGKALRPDRHEQIPACAVGWDSRADIAPAARGGGSCEITIAAILKTGPRATGHSPLRRSSTRTRPSLIDSEMRFEEHSEDAQLYYLGYPQILLEADIILFMLAEVSAIIRK